MSRVPSGFRGSVAAPIRIPRRIVRLLVVQRRQPSVNIHLTLCIFQLVLCLGCQAADRDKPSKDKNQYNTQICCQDAKLSFN